MDYQTNVIKKINYINKICLKMGGSKNAKKSNGKRRFSIVYERTKVLKMGSPNNEGVQKP